MSDPVYIDEDAESWINLAYCRDAAKTNPALRKDFVERLAPDVLKAADECTDYEDFERRLERYRAAEKNENDN